MGKYVISKTPKGKYHFDLIGNRGEIILSSQMYMARKGALKGARSTIKNAKKAPVEDQTAKVVKSLPIPKFVIAKGKDKKFHFALVANNGKAVGTSKAYATLASAKKGIKSVKANSKSPIERKTVTASKAKKTVKKKATKRK